MDLIKKGTLKREMKAKLGKDVQLSSDAINAMKDTLETIFSEIMAKVTKEPYRSINGYLTFKYCIEYIRTQEDFRKHDKIFADMQALIDLAVPKKVEGNNVNNA